LNHGQPRNRIGTISFGLVSIPVKLYTANSPQRVGFNFLHEKCGTRVKMQYYCPFDQEVVTRQDMIKGYEHAKDRFVTFTDEELKKLESEKTDRVDIVSSSTGGRSIPFMLRARITWARTRAEIGRTGCSRTR
jgi:non-homologous end joining protein Ku